MIEDDQVLLFGPFGRRLEFDVSIAHGFSLAI
jgi:hypothetical protein